MKYIKILSVSFLAVLTSQNAIALSQTTINSSRIEAQEDSEVRLSEDLTAKKAAEGAAVAKKAAEEMTVKKAAEDAAAAKKETEEVARNAAKKQAKADKKVAAKDAKDNKDTFAELPGAEA